MKEKLILSENETVEFTSETSRVVSVFQGTQKVVLTLEELNSIIEFININRP